jgi:hypothetical protein
MEDVAEELVGEIGDEHDARPVPEPLAGDGGWLVPGSMLVDEVERLVQRDLPRGGYTTVGGLLMAELGRLPERGDTVAVAVPGSTDDPDGAPPALAVTVRAVRYRVPEQLELRWAEPVRTGERS